MRTKKNIVHRRHSIKRNVLDKIKSRTRKNNVKFNNTYKTKLRTNNNNNNISNQCGGGKKEKYKKSNCKLSIEDIYKDKCLYNLVVDSIYDTVENFLGEEKSKTRKELYNSIKDSVMGVLMHVVKFRDDSGNLLITNHIELDDILDFFTIFFIVTIYYSEEKNTTRLQNFLKENFLKANVASDFVKATKTHHNAVRTLQNLVYTNTFGPDVSTSITALLKSGLEGVGNPLYNVDIHDQGTYGLIYHTAKLLPDLNGPSYTRLGNGVTPSPNERPPSEYDRLSTPERGLYAFYQAAQAVQDIGSNPYYSGGLPHDSNSIYVEAEELSESELKSKLINDIDSNESPILFSAAVVYKDETGEEEASAPREDTDGLGMTTATLNVFIGSLNQKLKGNNYFTDYLIAVKEKVLKNLIKVKNQKKLLSKIGFLKLKFDKAFQLRHGNIELFIILSSKSKSKKYEDIFNKLNTDIIKLRECLTLLYDGLNAASTQEDDISKNVCLLFILFFMTLMFNICEGIINKEFIDTLDAFKEGLKTASAEDLRGGGNEEPEPEPESTFDTNVVKMIKKYQRRFKQNYLYLDNTKLAENFTNIIPILISRGMKGGFISPFIRNFKNAIKRSSKSSQDPNSIKLVNHIFFIEKEKRDFKYDDKSDSHESDAMTTYTFGSNLQNTFDITSLGTINTGKKLSSPIKSKSTLSGKYFIEAPDNSNIKTRILGSNYTKQTIKTSNNFIELLNIKMDELIKGGIVSNFHTALETSNEIKVKDLHAYSYRLYSEQDLKDAVPDTNLYAQTQLVSELFNALKHSVVSK